MSLARFVRPPESDNEYVAAVRESLKREKISGVCNFLVGVGLFSLIFLVWRFLEWPVADEIPELYYHRASGLCFGIVGGALGAFGLYSLYSMGDYSTRRLWLGVSLILVIVVAVLLLFWVPSLIKGHIEGERRQASFEAGVSAGMYFGVLLYAALQNAIWARQKLGGERRAERLAVKYHDQLKGVAH